jgi:hypothetical protein
MLVFLKQILGHRVHLPHMVFKNSQDLGPSQQHVIRAQDLLDFCPPALGSDDGDERADRPLPKFGETLGQLLQVEVRRLDCRVNTLQAPERPAKG